MLIMLSGAIAKRIVVYRSFYCPRDPRDRNPAVFTPREVVLAGDSAAVTAKAGFSVAGSASMNPGRKEDHEF